MLTQAVHPWGPGPHGAISRFLGLACSALCLGDFVRCFIIRVEGKLAFTSSSLFYSEIDEPLFWLFNPHNKIERQRLRFRPLLEFARYKLIIYKYSSQKMKNENVRCEG